MKKNIKYDTNVVLVAAVAMVIIAFIAMFATLAMNYKVLSEVADIRGDLAGVTLRVGQMEQWATGFSQAVIDGFKQIGYVASPVNSTVVG